MKIIGRLSSILGFAAGYRAFGQMVRGNAWQVYLAEYVKPVSEEKVLDIGCGPADILNHLPRVEYTGFDISAEYIASAKKRFGNRGNFYCSDVGLAAIGEQQGTFDLVMATGVVHHLEDAEAVKLFDLARYALRPDGRLLTFDGCYVPEQSKIARWMLDHDRGKFVRAPAEYVRLAGASFSKVESHLRQDLLRIPYTHLIMRCSH